MSTNDLQEKEQKIWKDIRRLVGVCSVLLLVMAISSSREEGLESFVPFGSTVAIYYFNYMLIMRKGVLIPKTKRISKRKYACVLVLPVAVYAGYTIWQSLIELGWCSWGKAPSIVTNIIMPYLFSGITTWGICELSDETKTKKIRSHSK